MSNLWPAEGEDVASLKELEQEDKSGPVNKGM